MSASSEHDAYSAIRQEDAIRRIQSQPVTDCTPTVTLDIAVYKNAGGEIDSGEIKLNMGIPDAENKTVTVSSRTLQIPKSFCIKRGAEEFERKYLNLIFHREGDFLSQDDPCWGHLPQYSWMGLRQGIKAMRREAYKQYADDFACEEQAG